MAALNRVKSVAEDHGVTVCVELLNSKVNHKDYHGDRTPFGVAVVSAVNSPRVKLLYDIYHAGHGGRRHPTIRDNQQWIAHYHTAGVPGRHELDGTQELQYPAIAKAIVDIGFTGFMAQEFVPVATRSRRCGGRGALRRVRSRNRPRLAFVELPKGRPVTERTYWETINEKGNELLAKLKELLHEGNVRHVVIKQAGKTVAEFPITVGVVGAVFAPTLAAVGAVVAVLTDCTWKSSEPNLSRSEARTLPQTGLWATRYFRCFPAAWSSRTC